MLYRLCYVYLSVSVYVCVATAMQVLWYDRASIATLACAWTGAHIKYAQHSTLTHCDFARLVFLLL